MTHTTANTAHSLVLMYVDIASLLKIGCDDYTHNWCELVATVSTPIYSVMFTPTMQYTAYHL